MKDIKKEFYTVRGYELLMLENKEITSAMEDYLEMIYRTSLENEQIRIKNLANLLNVKASSVTKMVQKLSGLGLLSYQKYGPISLTEQGKHLGSYLLNRHNIIEDFLKLIGSKTNALKETELIEHYISYETLTNLEKLKTFLLNNPNTID